jgi:predicted trehalose synthase
VERDAGADRLADWRRGARARFLAAYATAAEAPDTRLLRAFELEKACYELRYEAHNRPDWFWLPLAGLRRLMAESAP